MKFKFDWLKELSGTKRSAEEIKEDLTLHSFEVEGIEKLGEGLEDVVIGEVLEVEKHPDADKLNVAKVNVGRGGILQIVCGAPNLKAGQKVPVALAGAKLPGDFKIKEAEIRGVKSSGMICAEDELGLGDNHEGIIVLPEDAPVGEKFAKYQKLDDKVLEIDILPNRAHDALSYEGVAREIALLEGRAILSDNKKIADEFLVSDDLKISIETEKCPRYIGAKIKNIKIANSPQWLKNRLQASRINPINNIVDITNYVMLETGQPLHAFDAGKVKEVLVRMANAGEEIEILNGEKVSLRESDIVITDGKKPIALAGVMGGAESGVNEKTTEIILESANFDAVTIRKTKSGHNIDSDAAYRYERDVDVNLTERAMTKALKMIKEIVGGKTESIADIYPQKVDPWMIELEVERVERLLGTKIEENKIVEILNNLGIEVSQADKILTCKIPTRRIDLKNQEDLIEEIGRVFGYTKIAIEPLQGKVIAPKRNSVRELERTLKNILAHNGFDEVRGYSFYSQADAKALGLDDENHVALLNPMNPDQALIRRTLMSGILRAGKKSLSYFDALNIFDSGKVYNPNDEGLPEENLLIAGAVIEKGEKGEQFFFIKGVLEKMLAKIGIEKVQFTDEFDENETDVLSLHKSRRALIKTESGIVLGVMGEITKSAHKHFGIKKMRAAVFELDVEKLLAEIKTEKKFKSLDKFPLVSRDLSMMVNEKTLAQDVKNEIQKTGGELLKEVELFDAFVNPQTKERSMAFHLIFGHPDRTLKAQEADDSIEKIIVGLENNLEVAVRKK